MQVECNVNPHPSQRYCLPTTWHAAHNLPIPPTNHCRQQRNATARLGNSGAACILGVSCCEQLSRNPACKTHTPFSWSGFTHSRAIFHLHQFAHRPFRYQHLTPLPAKKPLQHPYYERRACCKLLMGGVSDTPPPNECRGKREQKGRTLWWLPWQVQNCNKRAALPQLSRAHGGLWDPLDIWDAGSPGKVVTRPPDMLHVDAQICCTHDMLPRP